MREKSGGGNVKILLPETELQGFAGRGEQREGGRPGTLRALLRNMYKKKLAFLYIIMYYHTNAIKNT